MSDSCFQLPRPPPLRTQLLAPLVAPTPWPTSWRIDESKCDSDGSATSDLPSVLLTVVPVFARTAPLLTPPPDMPCPVDLVPSLNTRPSIVYSPTNSPLASYRLLPGAGSTQRPLWYQA